MPRLNMLLQMSAVAAAMVMLLIPASQASSDTCVPGCTLGCSYGSYCDEECRPGWREHGRRGGPACARCQRNCAMCEEEDSDYSCYWCFPGFYLNNYGSCRACGVSGCSRCDQDKDQCDRCLYKHRHNREANTCEPCREAHCRDCPNDAAVCTQCDKGYGLTAQGNCQRRSEVAGCFLPNPKNIKRCSYCDTDLGYTRRPVNPTGHCQPLAPECPVEKKCLTCDGEGNCLTCYNDRRDHVLFDLQDGVCVKRIPRCEGYVYESGEDNPSCQFCFRGFGLNGERYGEACVECEVHHCKTCDEDKARCQLCDHGFYYDDNTNTCKTGA